MSGSKAKASRLQSQQGLIRASIASLQSVELRERIINYLDKNPEMLAPCWHALEKGLFDPNMTQVDKLKFWLPESNTRIKHVARYFLEECLEKMDPRFTDEVCGKLGVGGDSKTIFQLFYFATRLQEFSVVFTRHRRSFLELVVARHKAQGARLKKLNIDQVRGDGTKQDHCFINWGKHGCYKLDGLADGKYTKLVHISGAEAFMQHRAMLACECRLFPTCVIIAVLADVSCCLAPGPDPELLCRGREVGGQGQLV